MFFQKMYVDCKVFLCITLITLVFMNCKTQENTSQKVKAVIIFKSGAVTLTRGNTIIDKINVKDSIHEGDRIATEKNSFVIIQLSSNSVIRIQENSSVIIKDLVEGKSHNIQLNQGDILAKVKRLQKGENFTINTPTIVASVRGTSFRVLSIDNKVSVAVSSGKVAVKPGTGSYTEKIVNKGSAIDLKQYDTNNKKQEIKMIDRPLSKEETLTLQKISTVAIVTDIDKKDADDLKPLHKDIQQNEESINKELHQAQKDQKASVKQLKIQALIAKKSKTLTEIKEVFEQIDEVTLYSGRIIQGAILSKGDSIHILTTTGTVVVFKKDIKLMKVIQ